MGQNRPIGSLDTNVFERRSVRSVSLPEAGRCTRRSVAEHGRCRHDGMLCRAELRRAGRILRRRPLRRRTNRHAVPPGERAITPGERAVALGIVASARTVALRRGPLAGRHRLRRRLSRLRRGLGRSRNLSVRRGGHAEQQGQRKADGRDHDMQGAKSSHGSYTRCRRVPPVL